MTQPKILVIDDETAVQQAIKKALKGEKYTIIAAKNGKEGLAALKKEKPTLVFLDLRMPVMDGIEFLKTVKLTNDSPYKVVIITGHGDEKDITECYKLGAHCFLRKPLSLTEITSLTKSCIDLKLVEVELANHRENLERLVDLKTKKVTEQLQFQQSLVDSIATPIYVKDAKQKIIGTNKAFQAFFNVTEKRILGKTFTSILSASGAKKEAAKDAQILKSGRTQNYQTKINIDNKKYDVVFSKGTFKNHKGKIAGIIGAIFDVTDREVALDKLNEKSKSLNQANMSLRILIKQLSDAQSEDRQNNMPNLKELVMPNSDQLGAILSSPSERAYLENIMLNLNRVTSPFAKELSQMGLGLSPKEIQVADLIRIGLSNKESAIQMNVTKSTVEFHRDNLRKKLGLKHKKKNLRAYLMALEAKFQKKR